MLLNNKIVHIHMHYVCKLQQQQKNAKKKKILLTHPFCKSNLYEKHTTNESHHGSIV